mmetsp:Transcript_2394/g.7188  ORF Transcript_2394/g.7188 Transcript_2394/m.7188 type:complete len:205 (-) Transcript_2394:1453-2067(-)
MAPFDVPNTTQDSRSDAAKVLMVSPSAALKIARDIAGLPRECKRTSTSVAESKEPRFKDKVHCLGAALSFKQAPSFALFKALACCSLVNGLPNFSAATSLPSTKFKRRPDKQIVPCSGRHVQCRGTKVAQLTVCKLARLEPSHKIPVKASSKVKNTRWPAETRTKFAWWPDSLPLVPRYAVESMVHTKIFFSQPTVIRLLKRDM